MSEEKRKYLRFECLVPVELVEVDENGQPGNSAFIDNISREGVRVVLDMGMDFGPGKDLKFKIYSPESRKTCSLKGEIVWIKPAGNKVEIGLRIKDMENCSKSELLDIGYNRWREDQAKAQAMAEDKVKAKAQEPK
jgi:hypothetical protein